jgi:hypothetical protein
LLSLTENELSVKVDIEDRALCQLVDLNLLSNVKIEKGVSVNIITVHFSVDLSSLSNVKIEKGT